MSSSLSTAKQAMLERCSSPDDQSSRLFVAWHVYLQLCVCMYTSLKYASDGAQQIWSHQQVQMVSRTLTLYNFDSDGDDDNDINDAADGSGG